MSRRLALVTIALTLGLSALLSAQRYFQGFGYEPTVHNVPYDGRFTFARLKFTSGPGGYYYRGMPAWAQWIGEVIPVTHFLRVVRGSLLKSQTLGDQWRELAALTAFVCVVTALAMARYRRTLD